MSIRGSIPARVGAQSSTLASSIHVAFKSVVLLAAVAMTVAFNLGSTASAAPPTPGPDEVALVFPANGDLQPDGSQAYPTDVVLQLTEGGPGGQDIVGSWSQCTVASDGNCTFIVPVSYLPARGSEFSVRLVSGGSQGFALTRATSVVAGSSSGAQTKTASPVALSRPNPALPATCGSLKIAFVADLSSSMEGASLASLKTTTKKYVDALVGTRTEIALFTFSTLSPADTATNQNRPLTSVQTQTGAEQVKSWIDGWLAYGMTRWNQPLVRVAEYGTTFDLVIFVTDGGPTSDSDVNAAAANAVKLMGTRIVVTLVGTVSDYVSTIAGPVHGDPDVAKNDYFETDWAQFGTLLGQLATVCPGIDEWPVTVQYVDDATGTEITGAPAATSLKGKAGDPVGFTEAMARAGVPEGYDFVSLDNVDTFSADPQANQVIKVHVVRAVVAPSPTPPPADAVKPAAPAAATPQVQTGGSVVSAAGHGWLPLYVSVLVLSVAAAARRRVV